MFGVRSGGRRGAGTTRSLPRHFFIRNDQWQEVRLEEGPTRDLPATQESACHTKDRPHGEPLEQDTIIRTFSNQCSCIVREKVPITYNNWKKVPKDHKGVVWEEVKRRFTYLAEGYDEEKCKGHALYVAGKALLNFRSFLNTEYVKKGKTPFEDYNFIMRDVWEEFVVKHQPKKQRPRARNSLSSQRGTSSTTT